LRKFNTDGTVGPIVSTAEKVSFCVMDENRRLGEIPGSPDVWYYPQPQLATGCSADGVMGLSPGWSDEYGTDRDGQYLDISPLAKGDYCLSFTSDPVNHIA